MKTLLGYSWLADGVTKGEEQTLRDLAGPYRIDRYGLSALSTKPWFKDGFSDEELSVVGYLISIANRSRDRCPGNHRYALPGLRGDPGHFGVAVTE